MKRLRFISGWVSTPRAADQQVRGTALLPNGLGKKVRVMVFAQGEGARLATEAEAEYRRR